MPVANRRISADTSLATAQGRATKLGPVGILNYIVEYIYTYHVSTHMNNTSFIQFIQQVQPMSQQKAEEIISHFEQRELAQGEYLIEAGQRSNEYLYLEDGFMRAYTYDVEGNEVTTNFYAANSVVFEVASFFGRTASKEYIQALTPCSGYIVDYESLNQLFHTLPEFREFGRAILVKGFVALKERTLSLINDTAEERYAALLERKPEIFQYAPLKHIASYLGITDTSLSRIRREFQKK